MVKLCVVCCLRPLVVCVLPLASCLVILLWCICSSVCRLFASCTLPGACCVLLVVVAGGCGLALRGGMVARVLISVGCRLFVRVGVCVCLLYFVVAWRCLLLFVVVGFVCPCVVCFGVCWLLFVSAWSWEC